MQQPLGYVDPTHPSYMCKLHKSLYGLEQDPRAWFERFTFHLLHLGFTASMVDISFFIFHSTSTIIYLLLYVDDIESSIMCVNTLERLDPQITT